METERDRYDDSMELKQVMKDLQTATVSYVGKADFGECEQYVREFHGWAPALFENILLEVSAINGVFTIDFIQNYEDRIIVDAFLKQLEEYGIKYEEKASCRLELPKVSLPWLG